MKEGQVKKYFLEYKEKNGAYPTFSVASKELGKTPGNIYFHYKKLIEKGLLSKDGGITLVRVGNKIYTLGDEVKIVKGKIIKV